MSEPSFSLSSVLPASKPPRPRWILPAVVVGVVLLLVLAGLAALRPWQSAPQSTAIPTATATAVITTAAPKTTRSLDAVTDEACNEAIAGRSDDFVAMRALGSKAAQSSVADIRARGGVLHDRAADAAKGPTSDADPMGYLKNWGPVTDALTDLLKACTAAHR